MFCLPNVLSHSRWLVFSEWGWTLSAWCDTSTPRLALDRSRLEILHGTQMEQANQRIKVLQFQLKKLEEQKAEDSDNDDDDEDLDDRVGIQAELDELLQKNDARQKKLDEYEKNKKWNVDNMFQVKEERTLVNPSAAKLSFTETGYIQPKNIEPPVKPAATKKDTHTEEEDKVKKTNVFEVLENKKKKEAANGPKPAAPSNTPGPDIDDRDVGVFYSYPEFCEKYADTVELFMKIPDLEELERFFIEICRHFASGECRQLSPLGVVGR